ncbi:MAG: hypothetical protein H6Q90_1184 [Deltaproteobacteria bacterium]|nr:hypothetical protein [Deltaproteobacteria bacterium]
MLSTLWLAVTMLSPGITYDVSGGYYTIVIDLDSDATEVRVPLPHATAALDQKTVEAHALEEGATVAINANYFGGSLSYPCGLARGFDQTYSDSYSEAGNCNTSLLWARGMATVIDSLDHEHDPTFHPAYSDAATGGGWLVQGGQRHDWNHTKLEAGRGCTAIGVTADRKHFVMVVTNPTSCSGTGLQDVMLAHGASDAIHLDGGGSSKLWIRGQGYVNGEAEDRKPSIVLIARPNGTCPSDCGSARCVQLARPFRAQCVGQTCRAGLSPRWNCEAGNLRRAHCNAGGTVEYEYCPQGCMVMANGQDDVCVGGPGTEPGSDPGADAGTDDDQSDAGTGAGNNEPDQRGGCCSADGSGPVSTFGFALASMLLLGSKRWLRSVRDRIAG